jgi:outer membrane lipoprotein-sorting protein
MHLGRRFALAASIALLLLPARAAFSAADLKSVLAKLDAASVNFHSTTADFEFDTVQTEPIPDTDVQKGTSYYQREGKIFKMAAHIREVNGKPVPKMYMYTKGVFQLYEKLPDQVTRFSKAGQFESYVMLGFGASGQQLADKWNIKYLGPETLDDVKTEKLELIAKDETVRKSLPKVTIWVDPERGVSLKQVFDQGQGQTHTCLYSNIKVNQPLPADAFTFKTDSHTQYIER